MKVFIVLALTIAAVSAHDFLLNGRETPPGTTDMPWKPDQPPCSYIVNPPYSAFKPRITSYYEYDSAETPDTAGDHTIETYCEHCGVPGNTVAPPCDAPNSEQQWFHHQMCENPADVQNCQDIGVFCPYDKVGTHPIPPLTTGQHTARFSWNFLAQGNVNFYSCTDLEVQDDSARLGTGQAFAQLILSNLFWLAPVALLPVVAAAIYARRHKRESIRLSRMSQMSGVGDARMTMMSGVTAKTAAKYQSGFTDNMSAGTGMTGGRFTMMSGQTAATAQKYQSGFTNVSAGSGMSGQTAPSAQRYQSGFTGGSSQGSY